MQSDTHTVLLPEDSKSREPIMPDDDAAVQRIKNEVAIRLLQSWLSDESGYDEKNWETVKKLIEENRLSNRSKFDE